MRTYNIHEFECICLRVAENIQLNALECYYAEQYNAYVWDGGYNDNPCGTARVCEEMSDAKREWKRRMAIRKRRKG